MPDRYSLLSRPTVRREISEGVPYVRKTEFRKIHDIEELMSLLPANARPNLSVEEQARLTDYGVSPRYPGWGEVALNEARRAVALARRIRKHIRPLLPKEALKARKP